MEALENRQKYTDDTLDKTHPNYRRWQTSSKNAELRGGLVVDLLSTQIDVRGKQVLDIGCGEGGTSIALAKRGACVTAIDNNPKRINKLKNGLWIRNGNSGIQLMVMNAEVLNFDDQVFDVVILQDVIEHTANRGRVIGEIARVLKPGGVLYLSTPNRLSPLNLMFDPHWGLPLISVLPRKWVGFMITRIYRLEQWRPDFAELLSLFQLKRLLRQHGFAIRFVNKKVARQLFENPYSVVWSTLHIGFIQMMKRIKLNWLIRKLVNERFGLFNYFINPTWYMICQRS